MRNATNNTPSPAPHEAPVMIEVWDLPLRILHWTLAASVLTAYFSANILDTVHEIAGYAALVAVALRLGWGVFGGTKSRFRSYVRPLGAVWRYLVQAARGQPGRYLGLNPAGAAMAIALLLLVAVSAVSGWLQITERFFGIAWVEHVHTWSSNLVMILVVVHVLGVLMMSVLQKENLVRAMITGRKWQRTP